MSRDHLRSDGRNIDPARGSLTGEGAGQRSTPGILGGPAPKPVPAWDQVPGVDDDPTYYDRPLLKDPVWIASVPLYFAIGGMGGAASLLGLVARLSGRPGLRRITRRTRAMAAFAGLAGTGLLVVDLGRPSRFLNMLRVFRPSSPMSVGSWVLATYAPAALVGTVTGESRGPLGVAGFVADATTGVLGMPLAGYTAVLLANSAIPVWSETGRTMPVVFMSSGVTAAASVLDLFAMTGEEAAVVRRFGVAGKLAELAFAEAMRREADRVPRVGKPLHEGLSGALWRAAKTCTVASLGLSLLPGGGTRGRRAAGLLGIAGSLSTRFAVFHAGKVSARDPRASFHLQRAGDQAARRLSKA